MSTAWSCELEQCSMSFSSLKRLDFHREINSKSDYYHYEPPALDENSAAPFACEVCLNLCESSGYPKRESWDGLRMKISDLQWSAKDGCPTCGIICEGLQHCGLCDERAIVTWSKLDYAAVSVTDRPVDLADTTMVDFFRTPDMNNSNPLGISRVPIHHLTSEDTDSLLAFQTVSKWLEDCTTKHNSCQAPTESVLPSRVLDLFPDFTTSNQSDSLDIRLSQTNNEFARYVCLSHCWGGLQPIMTTSATLTQHEERISWGALPRTFQDAVHFTRRLGIRYLWIDSLCIIQDDKKEWDREASSMCSIYENSFLTIAATKAKGASDGLYSKAPPQHQAHQIHKGESMPGIGEIYARRELSHRLGDLEYGHSIPPLMKRAWVYQERLLSPRVLHFAADELVWECNAGSCCECHPELVTEAWWEYMLDNGFSKMDHYSCLPPKRSALPSSESNQSSVSIFRWHRVAEEYSRLQLTYLRDKLPALAGIATQMSHRTGHHYMHGLWRETIAIDLLWYSEGKETDFPQRLPDEPSWSWASLPSEILYTELRSFDSAKLQYETDLLEPETKSINDTILGNDIVALKLSGKIIPCTIQTAESDTQPPEPQHSVYISNVPLDVFHNDQNLDSAQLSNCFCLLLARYQVPEPNYGDFDPGTMYEPQDYITNFGLVLAVVSWDSRIFRRIGMFSDDLTGNTREMMKLKDGFSTLEKQVITIV